MVTGLEEGVRVEWVQGLAEAGKEISRMTSWSKEVRFSQHLLCVSPSMAHFYLYQ